MASSFWQAPDSLAISGHWGGLGGRNRDLIPSLTEAKRSDHPFILLPTTRPWMGLEHCGGWKARELYFIIEDLKNTSRWSNPQLLRLCYTAASPGSLQKTDTGSVPHTPEILIQLVWGAAWSWGFERALQGILMCSQVWEPLVQPRVNSAAPYNDRCFFS